jgi:PQQ-dependent dehydrogenase (s-GDH family)
MKRTGLLSIVALGALCCCLAPLSIDAFQQAPFSSRVITTGLQSPWEITLGPDDFLWVSERVGKTITRVNPRDGAKAVAVTIGEVAQTHGQDGLLGMALHPQLLKNAANDYVYVAYTYDADPGPDLDRREKIRRYRYDSGAHTLGNPVDLITNLPAGTDHISGRMVIGADLKLYLAVGDQGSGWLQNYCNLNRAQELPSADEIQRKDWTRYQGKILRLNLDGSIPVDNPMLAGVRSHIYTYGHRNVLGLVVAPDGKLYASEHGPSTDDEVNIIEAGKNYGWPDVAGYLDDKAYAFANWYRSAPQSCRSLEFNAFTIPPSVPQQKESAWSHRDFKPPLRTFFTVGADYNFQALGSATIAPGGLDLYSAGDGIVGWANSLLVLSLKKGLVYRLKLAASGTSVEGEAVELFKSTNRYRDIALGRDNKTFYLTTDNQGNSTDASGRTVQKLENPGAILEFTYQGPLGRSN